MELANGLEREKCTGCRACEQICPTKCIEMVNDKEGFAYPIKDEKKCIHCNLCKKVCPILNKIEKNEEEPEVYALRNKDENVVLNSSSGGAFTSIMQSFCDNNTVIFGVKFDENLKVVHDYVYDIKDTDIFKKSKYVQSNIGNTYKKAKEFLNQGKKVLFTGTPCQIAGLKKYLNKEYEHLLLVDLICHGVPSQKIFDKYIEEVKSKYKKDIKSINFREKTYKNNIWNSKNIKIKLENNKDIIENSVDSPFLRGYHCNLFLRPSCENCTFANPNRFSDITIADCWGIEKLNKDMNVHEGQSMIVANSKKGKEIIEKIKLNSELIKLNLDFAIENNRQFREPIKFNKHRDEFFENIDKYKFSKLINMYIKKHVLKRKISKIIPLRIKTILKTIHKN